MQKCWSDYFVVSRTAAQVLLALCLQSLLLRSVSVPQRTWTGAEACSAATAWRAFSVLASLWGCFAATRKAVQVLLARAPHRCARFASRSALASRLVRVRLPQEHRGAADAAAA